MVIQEFWVINVSKMNVCLSDLGLTIPAGRCYNLLDSKHFQYTLEKLKKSIESGSLYKKRDKIKFCKERPKFNNIRYKTLSKQPIQVRKRTAVVMDVPKYDELIFSDEKYAEEIAGMFEEPEK